MLTIRLIRHAESAANAGIATFDPATIPLTENGHEQSLAIRDSFGVAPDRFICSPFLRVRQTASPTLARFAQVPVEYWPIHEFTYLPPSQCANTTFEQRRSWVNSYWDAADPQMVTGLGAESFCSFMERVQLTLVRLAGVRGRSIVVFGHGQFMQAIRWLVLGLDKKNGHEDMCQFRAYDRENVIKNGNGFSLMHDGKEFSV